MRAQKTPSGKWKVRIYDYVDQDGKQHMRSFTADTKTKAEYLAAEYQNKRDRFQNMDLTVKDALDGYITIQERELSPSTIRVYRYLQERYYEKIARKKIRSLTTPILQQFVYDLALEVSPKSVSNIYGLLSASLRHYAPDLSFKVKLPKKKKKAAVSPSDDDVRRLFDISSESIRKCIALAAFGSLRRGEICSLTFGDLNGQWLHVHSDMVQGPDRKWVIKDTPKTSDSIRDVMLPQAVVDLLGTGKPTDRIIEILPSTITKEFTKFRDRAGINIRFHDLRHYYVSIGAAIGIPDIYLADFGGWSASSKIMKDVYQNKIVPLSEHFAQKLTDHFGEVLRKES